MPRNNDVLILRILYAIILLSAFLLYRNYTIEEHKYIEETTPTTYQYEFIEEGAYYD